jgi:hypothetical protein
MIGMILDNRFPDWLQSELDKRQWSQAEFAYSAGISRAVINNSCLDKLNPPDFESGKNQHLTNRVLSCFGYSGMLFDHWMAHFWGSALAFGPAR